MKPAVLHVKDEVNVKIEGLDLDTRRKLSNMFKYEIPYARYLPAVRLGRWDGKKAFFQLGGSTFINLLPDILPVLEQQGYDVTLNDLRDYDTEFQLDPVDENSFSNLYWPKGHPVAGHPIILRDYQVETINSFLNNTQSLQEIATGAGKTLMTAALSKSVEQYGRRLCEYGIRCWCILRRPKRVW